MLEDEIVNHVHPERKSFKLRVKLEYDHDGSVRYYWRDFRNNRLTTPRLLLSNQTSTIQSPEGYIGYLGLVFEPITPGLALPDRVAGEEREYGFALLATTEKEYYQGSDSRFGMVHADIEDPYLKGWIKTMTWKTASPKWWSSLLEKRYSKELFELPIIVGKEWKSSDKKPIEQKQLEELENEITRYFKAHPETRYWETGIEENLRHRYKTQWYWPNLSAKIDAIKSAADKTDIDIRLIYQIAELRLGDVETFLNHPVSRNFDILALHPYAWPDFPTPEEWLAAHIKKVNQLLKSRNLDLPIWFTEIGVPHQGGRPGELFGYPAKGAEVKGVTPYELAVYIQKVHVIAFSNGVEKVFWYNYKDRNPERNEAENHFGLRDYWNYPKPAYPAYVNLKNQLSGREPGESSQPLPGVLVYEFNGQNDRISVAWSYPPSSRKVPVSIFTPGDTEEEILSIVDPMGELVKYSDTISLVPGEPIFVRTGIRNNNEQKNQPIH